MTFKSEYYMSMTKSGKSVYYRVKKNGNLTKIKKSQYENSKKTRSSDAPDNWLVATRDADGNDQHVYLERGSDGREHVADVTDFRDSTGSRDDLLKRVANVIDDHDFQVSSETPRPYGYTLGLDGTILVGADSLGYSTKRPKLGQESSVVGLVAVPTAGNILPISYTSSNQWLIPSNVTTIPACYDLATVRNPSKVWGANDVYKACLNGNSDCDYVLTVVNPITRDAAKVRKMVRTNLADVMPVTKVEWYCEEKKTMYTLSNSASTMPLSASIDTADDATKKLIAKKVKNVYDKLVASDIVLGTSGTLPATWFLRRENSSSEGNFDILIWDLNTAMKYASETALVSGSSGFSVASGTPTQRSTAIATMKSKFLVFAKSVDSSINF